MLVLQTFLLDFANSTDAFFNIIITVLFIFVVRVIVIIVKAIIAIGSVRMYDFHHN